MPDVLSWVTSRWSPLSTPAQPLRKPAISNPWALMPRRTTARITALSPGQSPPPVRMPMRATSAIYSTPGARADAHLPRSIGSASCAEILCIGRAAEADPGRRDADRDARADVAELRTQDVRAVPRALHPRRHDRRRRRQAAGGPGDVLAGRPRPRVREVTGRANAAEHGGPGGGCVVEVTVADHVQRMGCGGPIEPCIGP